MSEEKIAHMRKAHQVRCEFPFEVKELYRGYSDRILRIDLDKDEITILPVSQEMKDRWTGGKGFDLWLTFREVTKDTRWDSPENPICFSPGPLGGTTSFPGSGKTLVTAISPLTQSMIDCNVGGYFGPYLKFAGFDALMVTGKAKEETIIFIDAVNKKITIETAPEESVDSHLVAEELTEMYADNDLDKRNIAVVSAGRAAEHSRMGVLNFSFWDWRRRVTRLKQAGRGGVGTVFRNKLVKALLIKNRDITPGWRVEENKVAKLVNPNKVVSLSCSQLEQVDAIVEKWGNDPDFVVEMLQDIQDHFHFISVTALDHLTVKTGVPKAYLYHIVTFDKFFSLEEKNPSTAKPTEIIKLNSKHTPVLTRNWGKIDPLSIDQYIANGGYKSFKKVLDQKNPEAVAEEIKSSGLRCRCGGSSIFSRWETALKTRKETGNDITVMCNAVEVDSNSVVFRSILENDPHSVIEGMLIGAYALNAKNGTIIIKKEFTLAEERLQAAIKTATEKGYLGQNIQGSGFDFTITIHRTGGNFVPGEPTSIIASISGKAGDSKAKYTPIEENGYHGKPTIMHNAETWPILPLIIENGGQSFCSIGTPNAPGTKVFYLNGHVQNQGLIEVPMGTTYKEIIEELGGGISGGRTLKAIHIGSPAGTFIPASQSDSKYDLDSTGTRLTSSSLTIIDDNACMVDKLLRAVEILAETSCGKCTPCREGLYAIKNTLANIINGEGKESDITLLEDVALTMKETSLCSFGVSASGPVLSAIQHFKPEFEAYIKPGKSECDCCCGCH